MKRALQGREIEFNQTGKLSTILEIVGFFMWKKKQPNYPILFGFCE